MKPKTRKILITSVAVLSLAAITVWYLFPILMAKGFMYSSSKVTKSFEVLPHTIASLPLPRSDWEDISIDTLKIKLPISEYKIIQGKGQFINFGSDKGALLIYDLDPSMKLLTFKERLSIFETSPNDLSVFNSRAKNEKYSSNLILKAISLPHGGEVEVVNTENLKAICTISDKEEKGFSAMATLYGPKEAMVFSLMFTHYKDKTMLQTDLLNTLAGIRMPDKPLRLAQTENDINATVKKYNGTEQTARPDGE